MGTLKAQVTHSLNALKAFGESRHRALADGSAADKIYSVRTMQHYCELNVVFAQWCQEHHGLRRIGDITPTITMAFIADLRACGLSPATVSAYVCAIKKLAAGRPPEGKSDWHRGFTSGAD